MLEPLYTPANCNPAFQLRWSLPCRINWAITRWRTRESRLDLHGTNWSFPTSIYRGPF